VFEIGGNFSGLGVGFRDFLRIDSIRGQIFVRKISKNRGGILFPKGGEILPKAPL